MSIIKKSMVSRQVEVADEKMQEFAKKSLSMNPTDFCQALNSISADKTEDLIKIYDGYRFITALNMTLAFQKKATEAYESFEKASPSSFECDARAFTEKEEWIEWKKADKEAPAKTDHEYEEAYEMAKAFFEKAKDNLDSVEKQLNEAREYALDLFGKLSQEEQFGVLVSLETAKKDMFHRGLINVSYEEIYLEQTINVLKDAYANATGQSFKDVHEQLKEITSRNTQSASSASKKTRH